MKRLLLSVVGGFVIPFCYAITAGPLSTYTEDPNIHLLLDIPLGWPRLLYFRLTGPFSPHPLAANEIAFLLYIVGCDVLLYSLITYGLLLMLSIFKRRKVEYDAPPPPTRWAS